MVEERGRRHAASLAVATEGREVVGAGRGGRVCIIYETRASSPRNSSELPARAVSFGAQPLAVRLGRVGDLLVDGLTARRASGRLARLLLLVLRFGRTLRRLRAAARRPNPPPPPPLRPTPARRRPPSTAWPAPGRRSRSRACPWRASSRGSCVEAAAEMGLRNARDAAGHWVHGLSLIDAVPESQKGIFLPRHATGVQSEDEHSAGGRVRGGGARGRSARQRPGSGRRGSGPRWRRCAPRRRRHGPARAPRRAGRAASPRVR